MTTGPKYKIDEDVLNGRRLVTVSGEIDLASASSLEQTLLADPEHPVIADLTDVGFIDSTGLRSLLTAHEKVGSEGGRLLLVFDEGPVERILELTRLNDRFETFRNRDSAAQALE